MDIYGDMSHMSGIGRGRLYLGFQLYVDDKIRGFTLKSTHISQNKRLTLYYLF